MRAPAELGKAGRQLWRKVTEVLEFDDPRELIALRQAALLEDDLARLRTELADATLVVKGSTGQPVESPLLGAIRNAVALQSRLLLSIGLDNSAQGAASAGRKLVSHRTGRG